MKKTIERKTSRTAFWHLTSVAIVAAMLLAAGCDKKEEEEEDLPLCDANTQIDNPEAIWQNIMFLITDKDTSLSNRDGKGWCDCNNRANYFGIGSPYYGYAVRVPSYETESEHEIQYYGSDQATVIEVVTTHTGCILCEGEHRVAVGDKCICDPQGFVPDGRGGCKPVGNCPDHELWIGGRCVCDNAANYYGISGQCLKCEGENLTLVDNQCVCDNAANYYGEPGSCTKCEGENLAVIDNQCVCNSGANYYGSPGRCAKCEGEGRAVQNDQCECDASAHYVYNGTSCECDMANGWFPKNGKCVYCEGGTEGKCDLAEGDVIAFGRYFQEDSFNLSPLQWRVLARESDALVLISERVIEAKPYHDVNSLDPLGITWEESTIRSWLNGYGESSNKAGIDYSLQDENFLSLAFNEREKDLMLTSHLVTYSNQNSSGLSISGGKDTDDRIFLLSMAEAGDQSERGFFDGNESRKAFPTQYALNNGLFLDEDGCTGMQCTAYWRLRSPGDKPTNAASVTKSGTINGQGEIITLPIIGIRPAIRLKLNAPCPTRKVRIDGSCQCDYDSNYYGTDTCQQCEGAGRVLKDNQCLDVDSEVCDRMGGVMFRGQCAIPQKDVLFGRYHISNNTDLESIPWRVLSIDRERRQILLLSEYLLEVRKYDDIPEKTRTSWSQSTIRAWLNSAKTTRANAEVDYSNSGFLKTAFNEEERLTLVQSTILNDLGPFHGMNLAMEKQSELVFLLSLDDVMSTEFFPNRDSLKAYYTPSVGGTMEYNESWWLRSNYGDYNAASVLGWGNNVEYYKRGLVSADNGIRPAMWVKY